MSSKPIKLMIIAGEASGDAHAASLVAALRTDAAGREISFFGSAGPRMREAGVESVVDADKFAIVGVPEVVKALPMFLRARRLLLDQLKRRKPDAVVLVDFPEFNLKLARTIKKLGIPVVYFISPQLWAWRKYRIRTIRKNVDLLLSILPFEQKWYSSEGIEHVEYIGNPLSASVRSDRSKSEFCSAHGLNPGLPIIALLPGSRRTEIVRHLPIMLEAAAELLEGEPRAQFVIGLARGRSLSEVDAAFANLGDRAGTTRNSCVTVYDETYDALGAADAAAVCSGTATLEAGIIGTPMVIVYKGSGLNYRLMMPLIEVEHFGLVNLIAEERVAVELIQDDLSAGRLADELTRLLEPESNASMRDRLAAVAAKLGDEDASKRAAQAILTFLEHRNTEK